MNEVKQNTCILEQQGYHKSPYLHWVHQSDGLTYEKCPLCGWINPKSIKTEREKVLMGFLDEARHICTRIVLRCRQLIETGDMKETSLMAYKFDIKTGAWLGDLNEARRKTMKEEGK